MLAMPSTKYAGREARNAHTQYCERLPIDAFDARLMFDATPEVRTLATKCLRLLGRLNACYTMRAPVEVDAHGLYHYRFDLVRDASEEGRQLTMRMALGAIYDEYGRLSMH
jgi:hypothetical protein